MGLEASPTSALSFSKGLASANDIGTNGAWHAPWSLCGELSSELVSYGPTGYGLLCMTCKLRIVFTFFNAWGGGGIKQRIFHDTCKLYEIKILMFTNKVSLEHSHIHPFVYILSTASLLLQ